MKKFITIMLVFALAFSTLTVSTFAASSSSKSKYVKVKRATYLKYKKAYKEAPKLKKEIKELKARKPETLTETIVKTVVEDTSEYDKKITDLQAQVDSLSNENAVLKEQLNNVNSNDDIDELKHRLSQQEDINDWLWMSIKSLGISYSNKTWTVPTSFPTTFMINGTKYNVVQEEE